MASLAEMSRKAHLNQNTTTMSNQILTWQEVKDRNLVHDASGIQGKPEDFAWSNHDGIYYPVKTIDCTPTWEGILRLLLVLVEDGNIEGRNQAKAELIRMAKAADLHNEQMKKEFIIQLDGGDELTLGEFLAINTGEDVQPIYDDDVIAIVNTKVGESCNIGGGATGITVVKRIR
jgi:hypothetical protein